MLTFRPEDEQGQWLADVRLNAPNWKPGDRIPRGRDTLELVAVRYEEEEPATLVVKRA